MILVAYDNNCPLGYLLGYNIDSTNLYCWMAGVIPKARRRKVLTLLMDNLFSHASNNNYHKISIKTRNKHQFMLMFFN